jgi:hypothetical protein
LALAAHKEFKDCKAWLDRRVLRVPQVLRVRPEHKGFLELKVYKGLRVQQVLKEHPVQPVQLVRRVQREQRVRLAQLARRELKAPLEQMGKAQLVQ